MNQFRIKITRIGILSCFLLANGHCAPFIDGNVRLALTHSIAHHQFLSVIVFFRSNKTIPEFTNQLSALTNVHIQPLNFMPALVVTSYNQPNLLTKIAQFPAVTYIALNEPAGEKIEISSRTKKPKNPLLYPGLHKWWDKNFKGQSGVIGIIDSGIDPTHPAFASKTIIINQGKQSGYYSYPDGIRSPHGTGVACIYAGFPKGGENIRGVSYKAPIILSTIAGEGLKHKENFWQTYSGLNWFFSLSPLKPSVINYSFGNGLVTCTTCPDWSGMAKIVDYIVNKHKILWVTSAGNNGFIQPRKKPPFSSTMTIPADNYNALTVANMNMYAAEEDSNVRKHQRKKHAIRYTSSRGPTLMGRKKPDITAPGNDTFTCAPDPKKYHFKNMQGYEDGYRLMGGTSAATPHVGGAILLIQEAGITNPLAIKALLINSADTWTDSKKPGPDDPSYPYQGGHHPRLGSEWNPTYGWGYINLNNAFHQKNHLILDRLTLKTSVLEYKMTLMSQDKITLVHERRVGFTKQGKLWNFSHLKLELVDSQNGKVLALDDSPLDTVHQVSLCNEVETCNKNEAKSIILRISLLSSVLEGANDEPFALAYS